MPRFAVENRRGWVILIGGCNAMHKATMLSGHIEGNVDTKMITSDNLDHSMCVMHKVV